MQLQNHTQSESKSRIDGQRGYIQSIRPVIPNVSVDQDKAAEWLSRVFEFASHGDEINCSRIMRLYQKLATRTDILSRRSVLDDYSKSLVDDLRFYARDGRFHFPNLTERMQLFCDAGLELAKAAYKDADLQQFERMYLVSCTGYDSPSILQRLLPAGWQGQYLMLGHMGCYATIPTLNLAMDAMLGAAQVKASIFSCELCTLHLDPTAVDPAQQVINMLFADGAIRVDIGSEMTEGGFEFIDNFEYFLPGTLELMTWRPASTHFAMQLSPQIPVQVAACIRDVVEKFLTRNNIGLADISHWAIHPGGIKIIETVAQTLDIESSKISASMAVYRSRGNMSSATVPHIWHEIMHDDTHCRAGGLVCSLAFGPGLTIVGNLMRRC
jgi:predicted naringenin-chalcone synthase